MQLIRNGLVAAAVGVSLIMSGGVAQAAPEAVKVVTTLDGTQGWAIDLPAFAYDFARGPNKRGTGSLQFRPNAVPTDKDKMFVKTALNVRPSELDRISFDYYFATDSVVQDPKQFYLNVYVGRPGATGGTTFYDCKYDYLASAPANGRWERLTVNRRQPADAVVNGNRNNCPRSIAELPDTDNVWFLALNAGDTSGNDAGMKGGFDNVVIRTAASATVYDFEPAAGGSPGESCTRSGFTSTIPGTPGNDRRTGTSGADLIDLLGGNDTGDALGGDDCLLGRDGNDRLTAGAGADEVRGGPGNDMISADAGDDTVFGGDGNDDISAGAGKDTVDAGAGNDLVRARDGERDTIDCGAGNDQVIADALDMVLSSCESRS